MRASVLVASALAVVVMGAPVFPDLNANAARPGSIDTMSEYFNMLASKVQQSRLMSMAPVCDLSKAYLPPEAAGLPPPSPGLSLKHIAVGRGTQNYTCDAGNATAAPVANGAVATLFNASCIAATYPDLAKILSKVSMQFDLTPLEATAKLGPANLVISGTHFFTNGTTPFFDLDTSPIKIGEAPCAKNSSIPAPVDAPMGQQGEPAVPWLKLLTISGATGSLQEVYRVETAGGSAPKTCEDQPAAFEVQYAAQYWFYEGEMK